MLMFVCEGSATSAESGGRGWVGAGLKEKPIKKFPDFMKTEFLFHIQKISLQDPTLSHLNPLHDQMFYLFYMTVKFPFCLNKHYTTKVK
jgi:hypothetical protein